MTLVAEGVLDSRYALAEIYFRSVVCLWVILHRLHERDGLAGASLLRVK